MSFYSSIGKEIVTKADDQIVHAVHNYFDDAETFLIDHIEVFKLGIMTRPAGKGKFDKELRFLGLEYKANKRIKNFDAGIYCFVTRLKYKTNGEYKYKLRSYYTAKGDQCIFNDIPNGYVVGMFLFKESKRRFFLMGAELDDNTATALVRTWKAFEDMPTNHGLFEHYTLASF